MQAAWDEAAGLRYVRVEPLALPSDAPLIVALHGRGADAMDLSGLTAELNPGQYRWIFPQGPRPVALGPGAIGWAWYELGDDRTVLAARDQLVALLEQVAGQKGIYHGPTILLGFSQGAVMALHVGLAAPQPFAALVAMSGYLPAFQALELPLGDRAYQPLLMIHGSQDTVIPVELAREARDWLRRGELEPEYHELPMGHQITAESLTLVSEFLARIL